MPKNKTPMLMHGCCYLESGKPTQPGVAGIDFEQKIYWFAPIGYPVDS